MVQASKAYSRSVAFLMAGALALFSASPCRAIVLGQIDDFQDGTSQGWSILAGITPVGNTADAGPGGIGDRALHMDTDIYGGGRLIVLNYQQWIGDWTAAGVGRVSMDIRNPGQDPLHMRLGIAGPDGVGPGAFGDVYTTPSIMVPADNQWHAIEFNVRPSDFISVGGDDIDAALAGVTSTRLFSSEALDFKGDFGGSFFLDNITALAGAPVGLAGDYNGNHIVDAADYTVWRDLLGQTGDGLAADGTGPGGVPDGVVDELDYDLWKSSFGNSLNEHGHHHGLAAAAAAVPEPASWLLFFAAIASLSLFRPRRLAN